MRRATAIKLMKIALSLALLAGILWHAGPRLVIERLAGMNMTLVAFAFVLLLGESLVRALNWFQLIRSGPRDVTLGTVTHAHFVGGFFGALLPSTIGTDIARSTVVATRSDVPVEAYLATTVLLNVLSLAVVCAAGLLAAAWVLGWPDPPLPVIAASAAVSFACLAAVAMAWFRASRASSGPGAVHAAQHEGLAARLKRRFSQFVAALVVLPTGWKLGAVWLVAAFSYALRSLGWLVLLAAAGVQLSWAVLLTIGPLVLLAAALPISVLGFGGYQAASVFLLAQWGVPPQHALAVSLIQSGMAVLLHAIGCVVYVAGSEVSLPGTVRDEKYSG